ncbi:hypothetical protein O3M35_011317 [Rhynocoris fuscipes]|uniref:FAM69 N-terminal domain-containing protein n=1 Tax=Rhynocoris fuscipes TaxID=488301 RepID=A0AAW1CUN4_9HEMI
MMLLKRLPGLAFKYKWFSLLASFVFIIFIFSMHWGFICFNWEPWSHLKTLCTDFGQKKLYGDLCPIVCSAKTGVDSVSCIRSYRAGNSRGSKSIFTAFLRAGDGTKVIFKSFNGDGALEESILNWAQIMRHNRSDFLPASIYAGIVRDLRLNRFDPLLHDNSYLLLKFYADRDVFPKLIGYCGHFYVTEYLPTALDSKMIDDSTSLEGWARRVHLAVELLQLVEQIDQESLLMCHITPSKFGVTNSGRVKLIDLEMILPKALVDSFTSNGKSCSSDSECNFYDCKSTCNLENRKCESPVINTNLQIICEKIFVGWSLPGRLLVPGLLMSVHTPMALASLLRQCAHDTHSQEITALVANRLSDTLAEIDISLEQRRINDH